MSLLVSTRQDSDGTTRIRAIGEIDPDNAYRLREATDQVLSRDEPWMIVVDLAAVPVIDRVGVGVLVSCYHAAAVYQVPLVIVGLAPTVHHQFRVCGLTGLFGLPTTITTPDGWSDPDEAAGSDEAGRAAAVAPPTRRWRRRTRPRADTGADAGKRRPGP